MAMNAHVQLLKSQPISQNQESAPGRSSRLRGQRLFVQPKLILGQVNDPSEREADRVATRVMRMAASEPALSASPQQISRNCAACQEEEEEKVRPKAAVMGPTDHTAGLALQGVQDVLQSPGQPLDSGARRFMEPRFGHDFSKIRIH